MADTKGSGKPTKVTSPIKLAHVVLRTRPETFASMVSFYKTFLGAESSHENEFISFLTYDDEHHRIAIVAIPDIGPKDAKTSGLEVRSRIAGQVRHAPDFHLAHSFHFRHGSRSPDFVQPAEGVGNRAGMVCQPRADAQHLLPGPGRQSHRDAGGCL